MVGKSDSKSQVEIETRLFHPISNPLNLSMTIREVFGEIDEWILELGPFRLFLNPFNRRWLYYDPIHDSWEDTGYNLGEVRFFMEADELRTEKILPENQIVAPQTELKLVAVHGPAEGKEFPLSPQTLIGAEKINDIQLDEKNVSDHHAMILQHKEGFTMVVLNREYGTYLNGSQVSDLVELHEGDSISLGSTTFVVKKTYQDQNSFGMQNTDEEEVLNEISCPVCMKNIPANSKFCNHCGAKLEE
jgi:hypothetical protein